MSARCWSRSTSPRRLGAGRGRWRADRGRAARCSGWSRTRPTPRARRPAARDTQQGTAARAAPAATRRRPALRRCSCRGGGDRTPPDTSGPGRPAPAPALTPAPSATTIASHTGSLSRRHPCAAAASPDRPQPERRSAWPSPPPRAAAGQCWGRRTLPSDRSANNGRCPQPAQHPVQRLGQVREALTLREAAAQLPRVRQRTDQHILLRAARCF